MASAFSNVSIQSEYTIAYDFEVLDIPKVLFLLEKYRPVMYLITGLYVVGIFVGQRLMENKQAFRLNSFLFWWNIGNSVFALVATIRSLPEFLFVVSKPNGALDLVCSLEVHNHAMSFWWLMWALSKFVELGDTVFIVLRKQKLGLVHWWHHSTILMLAWLSFELADPLWARMFVLNTFVHTIMYFYYALKALKINVPKRIAMVVTTLQLLQMATLGVFHFASMISMSLGTPCNRPVMFCLAQLLFMGAFTALLMLFFKQSYLSVEKVKKN